MTHTTIRMVERPNRRNGYRERSESDVREMLTNGRIRLEGVDGDEETDTVTYWYTRDVEER